MAWLASRRAATSGRRFLLRRMDYALLGRSMPAVGDPLRSQPVALMLGCLLAAGVLVAGAGMAVLRTGAAPGSAPLVMSRKSGALFVRVGEALHPVTNLASARLILNSPVVPRVVDDDRLGDAHRGPMLGIPGAPQSVGDPIAAAGARWTVCDDADGTTTVAVGTPGPPPELASNTAILVSSGAEDESVWLLYDGRRAAIDPSDPVTGRALRLDGTLPHRVSSALLNVVPEAAPISAPRIDGVGDPSLIRGFAAGSVLRVARAETEEYYAVLLDGLQRIGRLTADLIRFGDPHGTAGITTVAADLVVSTPLVDALPVASFPDQVPTLVGLDDSLCATWSTGRTTIGTGSMPPEGPAPVLLARADGDGPGIDRVRIPGGRSVDVTVTGLNGDSASTGRYLVTDAGVRFAVHDSATATALGLTAAPTVAPWSLIAALPGGPELARDAALTARDVVGDGPPAP